MAIFLDVERPCIATTSNEVFAVFRVEEETHCYVITQQWSVLSSWNKRHHDSRRASRSRFAGTIVRRNAGMGRFHRVVFRPYEIERPFICRKIGQLLSSRMHETCQRFDSKSLPVSPTAMAKEYLGCSMSALVERFEQQFQDQMTWDNFGKGGWVIDHIMPVSKFDFRKISHVRKACHWRNLRPCWELENIRKGNRVLTG